MTRNTRAGFASDVSFAPRLASSQDRRAGCSTRVYHPISPQISPNLPPISPQSPWNAGKYRPGALQILQVGPNIAG
jgi:hypothetical protein